MACQIGLGNGLEPEIYTFSGPMLATLIFIGNYQWILENEKSQSRIEAIVWVWGRSPQEQRLGGASLNVHGVLGAQPLKVKGVRGAQRLRMRDVQGAARLGYVRRVQENY